MNRRFLGPRMRRTDDDVAALESVDPVDQDGHVRIGRRDDAGNDSFRVSDIRQALFFIAFDDADGFFSFQSPPDAYGGTTVFGNLAFYIAQARLSDGFLG